MVPRQLRHGDTLGQPLVNLLLLLRGQRRGPAERFAIGLGSPDTCIGPLDQEVSLKLRHCCEDFPQGSDTSASLATREPVLSILTLGAHGAGTGGKSLGANLRVGFHNFAENLFTP